VRHHLDAVVESAETVTDHVRAPRIISPHAGLAADVTRRRGAGHGDHLLLEACALEYRRWRRSRGRRCRDQISVAGVEGRTRRAIRRGVPSPSTGSRHIAGTSAERRWSCTGSGCRSSSSLGVHAWECRPRPRSQVRSRGSAPWRSRSGTRRWSWSCAGGGRDGDCRWTQAPRHDEDVDLAPMQQVTATPRQGSA
jgi:hypothetical protein